MKVTVGNGISVGVCVYSKRGEVDVASRGVAVAITRGEAVTPGVRVGLSVGVCEGVNSLEVGLVVTVRVVSKVPLGLGAVVLVIVLVEVDRLFVGEGVPSVC